MIRATAWTRGSFASSLGIETVNGLPDPCRFPPGARRPRRGGHPALRETSHRGRLPQGTRLLQELEAVPPLLREDMGQPEVKHHRQGRIPAPDFAPKRDSADARNDPAHGSPGLRLVRMTEASDQRYLSLRTWAPTAVRRPSRFRASRLERAAARIPLAISRPFPICACRRSFAARLRRRPLCLRQEAC